MEEFIGLLLKALKFAAKKHQGQRRKGEAAVPYVNHLIDVTCLLWDIGQVRDIETLAAALLHDTLEDTDTSPEELEREFGAVVRALVEEVTDDKRLPKDVRKRLQIQRAAHASRSARHIKLADKISNVRDITVAPPEDWPLDRRKDYVRWAEDVIQEVRGTNAALERHFDEIARQARAAFES